MAPSSERARRLAAPGRAPANRRHQRRERDERHGKSRNVAQRTQRGEPEEGRTGEQDDADERDTVVAGEPAKEHERCDDDRGATDGAQRRESGDLRRRDTNRAQRRSRELRNRDVHRVTRRMGLMACDVELADPHREIDRVDIFEGGRQPVEMSDEEQQGNGDDCRDRQTRRRRRHPGDGGRGVGAQRDLQTGRRRSASFKLPRRYPRRSSVTC